MAKLQSITVDQAKDKWQRYFRGWLGYYRLTEDRAAIHGLERWIRRHIRKSFWLRWHDAAGRKRALRSLGIKGQPLKNAHSSEGAWSLAVAGAVHTALSNAYLRRSGFILHGILRLNLVFSNHDAEFHRMRKTARPVVWEGQGTIPCPNPIIGSSTVSNCRF